MTLKIVYHDRYNFSCFGLEKLHPFQADKFRCIKKKLLTSGKFSDGDFVEPKLDEKLILSYLSPEYQKKIKDKRNIIRSIEIPLGILPYFVIRQRLLLPMLFASCGTILATSLALQHGLAINLGGGFHHASFEYGWGFCIYPDIPIAIKELRKKNLCRRIAIVDCDAHQGDGTERALAGDPDTLVIDVYNCDIFPGDEEAKKFIDIDIGLGSVNDVQYLEQIEQIVLPALQKFRPELIIFGAGTDVYEKDPLSHLKLTKQGIITRDRLIISYAKEKQIPLTMVLSGGYHRDSADIVAQSIIENFDTTIRL